MYNAVAGCISRAELKTAGDVIRSLRAVYPTDAQFRGAFAEKQIRTTTSRNRQVVRYIMVEIERHVSRCAFDHASDKCIVEHILPEHPDDSWESFSDEQVDRCVYRIDNASYADKKAVYAASDFEITRRVAAENDVWTPERVISRQ